MTLRGDLVDSSVTLPSHDVVAKYIALGTEIPFLSVPQSGGDLLIQDQLLSPTSNPFGAADPAGIYWLDADNKRCDHLPLSIRRHAGDSKCESH